MLVLHKKDKNRGEIRIIINDLDKAALLVNGTQWININEIINQFNSDPDVNDLYITAVYTGELKDEKLFELFQKTTNIKTQQSDSENKVKVHSNGDEENNCVEHDNETTIKSVLDNFDLTCKECGSKHSALIDYDGKIYPCISCLKIDAYQKGKKEGFSEGFDAGYSSVLKTLQKLTRTEEIQNESDSK